MAIKGHFSSSPQLAAKKYDMFGEGPQSSPLRQHLPGRSNVFGAVLPAPISSVKVDKNNKRIIKVQQPDSNNPNRL